ncbi:MAG: leucyl/phenylalanyl-tRNA--protein transferase [Phycisphaerales bacterium]|nr:leucyl/phenylalanyl-tRNA--protein transferase [Phycisphaerales bacterium]MEC8251013.1 leucyl/phenylalanyl-tRNA--protein transferase [Planctomycetota bacterium]MEC8354552.1 leucyl/phenylalanyl-tRNA--protein transferase [Planctomycetota bacterium]MEC8854597.1 leucyl/phenylalanyl-tRNA--protein transferase [Planctomycetota bacterium]
MTTLASFLEAYQAGLFPMAEPNGPVLWYRPVRRAVLPLEELRVSDSLRRVVRSRRFEIRVNTAFVETIRSCSAPRSGESVDSVWLDARLQTLLVEAHHAGRAHSVEAWREGALVGGLYGLSFGSAFLGESMFHRPPVGRDASKAALVHLCHGLREAGYTLLDAQIKNEHTERLGVVEWDRHRFEEAFETASLMPDRMGEAIPAIRRGPFG